MTDYVKRKTHECPPASRGCSKAGKCPSCGIVVKWTTLEIELPVNFSFNVAIIDLVRSRYHGPPFPDETYRALFAPFIGP